MNVSVIIPAYNAERWIRRAIDSVLRQTVAPIEVWVVDDGSTDGTKRVLREYRNTVRYLHQTNAGPSAARNLGIDNVRSDWIAFLDADDEWLPHKIESQLRVLRENVHIRWCSCACLGASNGITPSRSLREDRGQGSTTPTVQRYFSAVLGGVTFQTSSFVIHRSVFEQVGRFDPDLRSGEDVDMWCRIAFRYPWIGYGVEPSYCYHQDNPQSAYRKGRVCRDLPLRSLCRNMRLAMELGSEIADEFRPYARKRIMDSLLRLAARDCLVQPGVVDEVQRLFPLGMHERALLQTLHLLPKSVAMRIVRRLRGRISL